jgi:hypothetical protein
MAQLIYGFFIIIIMVIYCQFLFYLRISLLFFINNLVTKCNMIDKITYYLNQNRNLSSSKILIPYNNKYIINPPLIYCNTALTLVCQINIILYSILLKVSVCC